MKGEKKTVAIKLFNEITDMYKHNTSIRYDPQYDCRVLLLWEDKKREMTT